MDFLKKVAAFFTPSRRKAVYGVVAAGTFALVTFGVVTQDQLNLYVQQASGVIAVLTTLMALLNVKDTDDQ